MLKVLYLLFFPSLPNEYYYIFYLIYITDLVSPTQKVNKVSRKPLRQSCLIL